MAIESCDISDDDIKSWWDAFLSKPNQSTGIPNAITGKNNTVFIFGNDENVSPVGTFRGKLRFKQNTNQRVIGPVINTNSEDKDSAVFETSNASNLYAFVRREGYTGGVEPVQWETKYTPLGNKFLQSHPGSYPFSGGAWFCIPAKALNPGDRVEFGGEGTRGFKTAAVWVVQ
jgi:hypothetical protein